MAAIIASDAIPYAAEVDVLIVGAGAAGLVTALRAAERGLGVLVVERDATARGSTSLSAGLIPAPATRFQCAAGISDTIDTFTDDIMTKAHGAPDRSTVRHLAETIGPALEWLADNHEMPFTVVDNFTYPGHTAMRMHGLAGRSGAELMDHLRAAAERAGIDILNNAVVGTLIHKDRQITGVAITRRDASTERIGCRSLVLACNGYGGNSALVARHIPEISGALYFGHAGNQGDALLWGEALGAATRHLSGYQGHGSVAHPHGILITWATITEGGFQINLSGRRFANEAHGYSEAAAAVIAEVESTAWTIFDARIAAIADQFEDFRNARAQGAVIRAATIAELASKIHVPQAELINTFAVVSNAKRNADTDSFGRSWRNLSDLEPPFMAVRVTGALFHTQGGLVVDRDGRVQAADGSPFPNLFATGGAACGVSGPDASGYLSGNGLLTAVAYGFLAGAAV